MIAIIFGIDEWKNRLAEVPKRCFWLLNASNGELTPDLITKINSVPLNHPKIPLIVGFISKSGDSELKKLLFKCPLLQETTSAVVGYKSSGVKAQ